MAVGNVGNALMGPASIYAGPLGVITAAPADALVNAAPGTAWTDLGGTNGGANFSVDPKLTELTMDQVVDVIEERLTGRTVMVTVALAENTLQNLARALNCGLETAGSNYQGFTPVYDSTATQIQKFSLLLDGFAPPVSTPTPIASPRRRLYLPRVQQVGKIEVVYAKDKQQLYSCQFKAYYVSTTVPPFRWLDQTGV
jgi:hypothetical protein